MYVRTYTKIYVEVVYICTYQYPYMEGVYTYIVHIGIRMGM
jgi:hypothetical protein